MAKSKILTHKQINRKIKRIAYQVYENNFEVESLYIIGIKSRGSILADRIVEELSEISPLNISRGNIKLNKDTPMNGEPECDADFSDLTGKNIILVDDVLNTGKTLMYAVKYLLDSNPESIQTVTLVDRRHRMFPVRADYVGLTLATTLQEHISVDFGSEDAVWLK